jgi:hypothetical protein
MVLYEDAFPASAVFDQINEGFSKVCVCVCGHVAFPTVGVCLPDNLGSTLTLGFFGPPAVAERGREEGLA